MYLQSVPPSTKCPPTTTPTFNLYPPVTPLPNPYPPSTHLIHRCETLIIKVFKEKLGTVCHLVCQCDYVSNSLEGSVRSLDDSQSDVIVGGIQDLQRVLVESGRGLIPFPLMISYTQTRSEQDIALA